MSKPKQLALFSEDIMLQEEIEQAEFEADIEQLELEIFGVDSGQIIYEIDGKKARINRIDGNAQIERLTRILESALKEGIEFRAWRDYEPNIIIAAVWREESGKWYSYVEQNLQIGEVK